MQKYRFIKFQDGKKWYAAFTADGQPALTLNRQRAALFSESDWNDECAADGYEREAIGEDQLMRMAGAQPRL